MKEKTIYALGFFDGVHLGHKALLRSCRELADKLGVKAGVVTFTSHPDALVLGAAPKLINTATDRRQLLKAAGMDTVVELPFDKAMMAMPWQDFFRLLMEKYGAAGLVCGADFRFGSKGAGNAALLRNACEREGIPCTVVPEQTVDGITVSSTHIRALLERGDTETAARFLGHPHFLTGTVVKGRQLGRTIGIPTANLAFPEDLVLPKLGVYACTAEADGKIYPCVTNVGSRPTVNGHHITVESWLQDFDGELYGKELTVRFYKFLRPEQKFDTLIQLQAQILRDAENVKKSFSRRPIP